MTERRQIFVVGLDDFNGATLDTIRDRDDYVFRTVLDRDDVVRASDYDVPALRDRGNRQLDIAERVDGVTGWWDFPTTSLLPMFRAPHGLPGPTLESILRCEHKGWSRQLQQAVLPEMTPAFHEFDPFEDLSLSDVRVDPPFWMKPVKGHSGYLGFLVRDEDDFREALRETRDSIEHIARPFNQVLEIADLEGQMAPSGACHCIAEQIIDGRQCTIEGYRHDGDTTIYAVIDSIRESNNISFRAYAYPSRLPDHVQRRVIAAGKRWADASGLEEGPFNMEFFWVPDEDRLWILEINARFSKSHIGLFTRVDGVSHQQVGVRLSHGADPEMPHREGAWPYAAKFMLREYRDAVVTHAPTAAEVAEIERAMPGVDIHMAVTEDRPLSTRNERDTYSFQTGEVHIGAKDLDDAENRYAELVERLPLGLDYTEPEETGRRRMNP